MTKGKLGQIKRAIFTMKSLIRCILAGAEIVEMSQENRHTDDYYSFSIKLEMKDGVNERADIMRENFESN